MDLLRASAVELAAAIRSGAVTSRAVVDFHVARLERAQPRTRAVVADRYDDARREADAADERVRAGSGALPPLHGVPCTIKEAFALRGMPNTSGLVSRRGILAEETAPAVQRLVDAGAIPLAVTNTPELCMWMETTNRVYGRTSNAYSARRTAGGSSGGEGAAVGSGGAPFGLGSDIGGSIRMPAFFNGVFGHKNTPGLVPNTGQFPPPTADADRLLATGPLCRRAEDLMPLLRILAAREDLPDPGSVALEGLPVVAVPAAGPVPVRREVRGAVTLAARALQAAGARVGNRRIRAFLRSFDLWGAAMSGAESYRALLGNGSPRRRRELLFELARGRSPHTLPSVALAVLESAADLTPGRTEKLVARGRELADEVQDIIGDGVLLYPPHPRVAPLHHRALLSPTAPGYTGIFNVLGLPVTQVPLGLTPRGVPTGVQVVARAGNDHVAIAVALELERRFGGWLPPPDL